MLASPCGVSLDDVMAVGKRQADEGRSVVMALDDETRAARPAI